MLACQLKMFQTNPVLQKGHEMYLRMERERKEKLRDKKRPKPIHVKKLSHDSRPQKQQLLKSLASCSVSDEDV